ncbi:hypothetical protein LSH36_730g01059 [Paralvinella palmiformis]|uniref:EGF-like domain-containing protein n=1 Tax=Paralvinella palmiformis TaxID=53620 RepID=A0AAD9J2A7_9ANNE|nr:hypothetical protein LSH36_730g01059 [Paralvinella palmiformis]
MSVISAIVPEPDTRDTIVNEISLISRYKSATVNVATTISPSDIDDCNGVVCDNGGSCVDEVDGFICLCVDGTEGVICTDPEG